MIEKNTVILSLKDYSDLIKENESLKVKVEYLDKDNYNLSTERTKLKKHILEKAELFTICNVDENFEFEYELERIIDFEDGAFGIKDHKRLLKLGFTLKELTDYIIERREFYEKEKENA